MGSRKQGYGRGSNNMPLCAEIQNTVKQENVVVQPPIYPPLTRKPVPCKMRPNIKQIVAWDNELKASMRKCMEDCIAGKDDERFRNFLSDKGPPMKKKCLSRGVISSSKQSKDKFSNVDKIFSTLEKKENIQIKAEVEEQKEENDNLIEEDEGNLSTDEEMDEGTDYNQNYFDNGEDYAMDDEDDEYGTY